MADPDPRPAVRPVGRLAARLRAWPREPRRPLSRNDVLSRTGRLHPPILTAGLLLATGGFPLLDPRLAYGVGDALMLLGGVLVTALLVLYVRRPVDPDASLAEPAAGTRARRVAGLRELGYLCAAEAYFAVSAVVRTGAGRVSSIALLTVGAFAAAGVVVNDIRPRPKRRRSREREAEAGGGGGTVGAGVDLVKPTADERS